jgi:hypothetical protein
MDGYEVLKFSESPWRDEIFRRLRHDPDHTPQERQAVKFSEVEAEMLAEDEFKLDDKGRIVYISYYFIAYPKEVNGRRVRERIERDDE